MSAAIPVTKYAARPNRPAKPLADGYLRIASTTVGSKFLVAITGLVLTIFVYVHMAGNLLVFRGPDSLNEYAEFLKAHAGLLWTARIGLLVAFVIHVWLALRLARRNSTARPSRYVYERTAQATWASRHMALTGLVILVFVIFHLAHYTFGIVQMVPGVGGKPVGLLTLRDPQGRPDVYAMVIYGFRSTWIVIAYIVAQVCLALHLSHGISSMFQTVGWTRPRTWPIIRGAGLILAAIILIGNTVMPLAVYLRLIGGEYAP